MRTLTVLAALMLSGLSMSATAGTEYASPKRDYVKAPEKLETTIYQLTAYVVYGEGMNNLCEAEMLLNIGFDGDDVYVQGLFNCLTEGWIKGVRSGSTLEFPNGQYIGKHTFMDLTEHEVWLYNYNVPIQWSYDDKTGTITPLVGNPGLIDENNDMVEYFMTYDIKKFSDLTDYSLQMVSVPAGLAPIKSNVVKYGTAMGDIFTFNEGELVVDGKDFYINGLTSVMNDKWVKGTLADDGLVHCPSGQYLGIFHLSNYCTIPIWFLGVDDKDVLFSWDPETEVLSLIDEQMFVESSQPYNEEHHWRATAKYRKSEVIVQKPVCQDIVTVNPPAGLACMQVEIALSDQPISSSNCMHSDGEMCIDGQNIYVKGLCKDFNDCWILGTLSEDGVVRFESEQFLGSNDSETVWFTAFGNKDYYEMKWDAATGTLADVEGRGFAESTSAGSYINYSLYSQLTVKDPMVIQNLDCNAGFTRSLDLFGRPVDRTPDNNAVKGLSIRYGKIEFRH